MAAWAGKLFARGCRGHVNHMTADPIDPIRGLQGPMAPGRNIGRIRHTVSEAPPA